MKAFLAYVRPVLAYASCVWFPQSVGFIKKIESVQRRFTKRFPCGRYITYTDGLVKLNTVFCDMLVSLLALCHLFEIKNKIV